MSSSRSRASAPDRVAAEATELAQAEAALDDLHGHKPCVGWGPHAHPSVEARGGLRLCWACWAKGYDLSLPAAPPPARRWREQEAFYL